MLSLRVTHKGRTSSGEEFVSDGTMIVLAELVAGVPAGGCAEIETSTLDKLVSYQPARWIPLGALARSQRRVDVLWAPGEAAITESNVGPLRALNRPLEVGGSGPQEPVLIRDGGRVVAVLMPIDFAPDSAIPPPAAGFVRGRVHDFSGAKGFGYILLEDGREVLFDVSARTALVDNGDLVDLELTTGRDGRLRARLAWRAGEPDPRIELSAAKAAVKPQERGTVAVIAHAEAQRNGLLLDMTVDAFHDRLKESHGTKPASVASRDVLDIIVDRSLRGTVAVLVANTAEGLLVGRDVHEGEEEEVQAELERFAAHFGVEDELKKEIADQEAVSRADDDDLLDEENLFLILGRTFARARRPERVFWLTAPTDGFAIIVRHQILRNELWLFQRAVEYQPQQDRRRSEIGFLAAHGVSAPPAAAATPSPAAAPVIAAAPIDPTAPTVPAPPMPPPPAAATKPAPAVKTIHLERFEMAARKLIHSAQLLADQRGHLNIEPLHIAFRLVERDVEPTRARIALQIAEQSLARLPKAAPGEESFLSTPALELLNEADRLTEGRPVDVPDLWRVIRRHRGSSAAIVLEAASD